MKRERKEKHFIQRPIYPGGLKAIRELIRKNLKYPEKALELKIEGSVHIRYTINYKGRVIHTKVVSSLGHGCDEEAMRLVKLFKFEIGKQHKVKVKFYKNIKIHFKLPKKPKAKKVTYQYTSSSKPQKKPTDPAKGGYTYTISL